MPLQPERLLLPVASVAKFGQPWLLRVLRLHLCIEKAEVGTLITFEPLNLVLYLLLDMESLGYQLKAQS